MRVFHRRLVLRHALTTNDFLPSLLSGRGVGAAQLNLMPFGGDDEQRMVV